MKRNQKLKDWGNLSLKIHIVNIGKVYSGGEKNKQVIAPHEKGLFHICRNLIFKRMDGNQRHYRVLWVVAPITGEICQGPIE